MLLGVIIIIYVQINVSFLMGSVSQNIHANNYGEVDRGIKITLFF